MYSKLDEEIMTRYEVTRASADIHKIILSVGNNSETLMLLQEFKRDITQHEKKNRVVLYDCVPGFIKLKCGRFMVYLSVSQIDAVSIEHAGYSSSSNKENYTLYEQALQDAAKKK